MDKRKGWCEDYLSHLSLLFRHGSQLIALRARFVGGRPSAVGSAEPGGGECLGRTVPEVVDLLDFCLADVGETTEEWSSAMAWRGMGVGKEKRGVEHISILIYYFPFPIPLSGVPCHFQPHPDRQCHRSGVARPIR
jgi:hypothetical protein